MANLDHTLDIDHRTAAFEQHERGLLVCLAGPGTGKTTSLLARTTALTGRGCNPETICYLTFIGEIRNAFVDDFVQRFGAEALNAAPRISTLHSYACRVLRNLGFQIGYDGDLYFADVAEADDASGTFLEDLLRLVSRDGCRTVPQLRAQVATIKAAWRDAIDPSTLSAPSPSILGAASDLLRCYRVADWDQTIALAYGLLRGVNELPDWIAKIKHYYVDEYQDFNLAEQAVIGFLAEHAESMVIVGDDDQSVYSGRGGSPAGIRALYADRRHDSVSLVKCYRCPEAIVGPTNAFQSGMSASPRPMVASRTGGEVLCYRFKSSKAEVAFLVDYLRTRITELPEVPTPKDGIVCLFPSKRVLNAYFEMLSPHIPCSRRYEDVSPARRLVERVLQSLAQPGQRFLERLLLNQYPDVKPRHRALIVARILERGVPPSTACETLIDDGELTDKALVAGREFVRFCNAIRTQNGSEIAQTLSIKTGADATLITHEIDRFLAADEYESTDLISTICDTILPETVVPPADPKSVQLLTMHSSKGLTRRTVVLPALEHACLPGDAEGGALEERRRLFFVALSRSTNRLLLTFPHNRGGKDSLNFEMEGRGSASPFIGQAGLSAIYHE